MGLFGYSGVGIQLIDKIMNKNSKLYLLCEYLCPTDKNGKNTNK